MRNHLQDHTVMFIHVPKAAGTTARWIMDRQYPPDRIFKIKSDIVGDQDKLAALPDGEKRNFKAIFGHYCHGLHSALPQGQKYAYVTILRDPVDRLVSLYSYVKYGAKNHYLWQAAHGMSFVDFITSGVARYTDNGMVRQLCGKDRFIMVNGAQEPYRDMKIGFGEVSDEHLSLAMKNIGSFACIGVSEKFDTFLSCMKELFAWRIPMYMNENITPVKTTVTDRDIDIAKKMNILDYRLYEHVKKSLTGERIK